MSWGQAELAKMASDEAKLVCCGSLECFSGHGCDTARWLTLRLDAKGYRLIRKPAAIK